VAATFLRDGSTTRLWESHKSLSEASKHLPDGAYSTLRTYSGTQLLRLAQHVTRLNESAALQGQVGTLLESDARATIAFALRQTAFPESRLRLTWAPPRFFVSLEPFVPLPEALYRNGVRCVSVPVRRENPHAKDTRFIATASAAYQSLPPDTHEGLMVAEDGAILEGLSSNFFAILDGALHSEGERVLLGVTRSLVLEVAAEILPFVPRAVRQSEVPRMSEAFLTSVSRGILPVTRIDDDDVGSGRPGPRCLELRARFAALEAREAAPI
jgi:branched-chain amino acid aminotransferase